MTDIDTLENPWSNVWLSVWLEDLKDYQSIMTNTSETKNMTNQFVYHFSIQELFIG